jgi:hypothetical protein
LGVEAKRRRLRRSRRIEPSAARDIDDALDAEEHTANCPWRGCVYAVTSIPPPARPPSLSPSASFPLLAFDAAAAPGDVGRGAPLEAAWAACRIDAAEVAPTLEMALIFGLSRVI